MEKQISILGSTGSIGTQALDVVRSHGLSVYALAANHHIDLLEKQTREFHPKRICIFDTACYPELKRRLFDLPVEILCGMEGLCEIAGDPHADILLNSVVGMVGLLPTLTAIDAGIDIALANKETLVAGGSLVMKRAAQQGVKIYPVDSEHSAIFQCLQGNQRSQLHKIILTASGGPFFGMTRAQLRTVKAADALRHPNWDMGNKITIDSATLMNKGLEFIEAKWLFDLEPEQIEIVVHRQSVIHSAVEFQDLAVIAQLGVPDMKIPIQYALLYPERLPCPTKPLSLTDYRTLTFEKPDLETFSCLKTAISAIRIGGTAPCIMNGANEVAVAAFLEGQIGFLDIGTLAEQAVEKIEAIEIRSYEDVMRADTEARTFVRETIARGDL